VIGMAPHPNSLDCHIGTLANARTCKTAGCGHA
jgi:hypothetical protein